MPTDVYNGDKDNMSEDPNGFPKQLGGMGPQIRWVACQGEPEDANSNARVWRNHCQDRGILCLKHLPVLLSAHSLLKI